jgi:spore coat polysaccharide biosynthesis protein SpsF
MNSRVIAIVQARMGSTRLPNKSMLDLAGAPLVGRIIERLQRTSVLSEIVLAIPDSPENEVLSDLAQDFGASVFKGSEDNLLDRYYQAARKANADVIVRIPADNPLTEPEEVDKIVHHHLNSQIHGFTSNLAEIFNSGYPDGIGAEVFDMETLEELWRNERNPMKLEHVHLNFFDYGSQKPVNAEKFPVKTLVCPPEYARPDLILDVNSWDQYRFIRKIYSSLYRDNPNFGIRQIIDWVNVNSTNTRDSYV